MEWKWNGRRVGKGGDMGEGGGNSWQGCKFLKVQWSGGTHLLLVSVCRQFIIFVVVFKLDFCFYRGRRVSRGHVVLFEMKGYSITRPPPSFFFIIV